MPQEPRSSAAAGGSDPVDAEIPWGVFRALAELLMLSDEHLERVTAACFVELQKRGIHLGF